MKGLKEHNHVFVHAQEFDFCLGGQEFKDARIDLELSQIHLHCPQLTLALPLNFSESKISETLFSYSVSLCVIETFRC